MALLKSAIQKAVRRSLPATARALLDQLVRQGRHDFLEFLRRLPIICIEDTVPHADLGFVVWLMATMTHGLKPTPAHIQRVGNFVEDIAGCPWRFPRCKAKLEDVRDRPLPGPRNPMQVACLIRSCYGGMGPDMRMLRGVPWHLLIQTCPRQETYHGTTTHLVRAHRLLEGVDFHCCPNMIRDIKRDLSYMAFSKTHMREAIWHCRSGKTNKTIYMTQRAFADSEYETRLALYEQVEDYIRDYSATYWDRFVADSPPPKRFKQSSIHDFFAKQ